MPDDVNSESTGAEGELPPPRKVPAKRGPRKSRPPVELDPAAPTEESAAPAAESPVADPATPPVKAPRARKATARKATARTVTQSAQPELPPANTDGPQAPEQPNASEQGEATSMPAPAKRAPRKRAAKAAPTAQIAPAEIAPAEIAPAEPVLAAETPAGDLDARSLPPASALFQAPTARRRSRAASSAATDAPAADTAATLAGESSQTDQTETAEAAESAPSSRRRGGRPRKTTSRRSSAATNGSEDGLHPVEPLADEALTELLLDAESFDEDLVVEAYEPDVEVESDDAVLDEDTAEDDDEDSVDEESADEDVADSVEAGTGRRRRRRGRRGRGPRAAETDHTDSAGDSEPGDSEPGDEDADDAEDAADGDEASDAALSPSARRRRRRRRSTSASDVEVSEDDPPNTVVHVRDQKAGSSRGSAADADGVRGVKGSTRLEAKRQRRRDSRDSGRRRAPIVTEAEFLARRESVERVMAVRQIADRTQIAVLEDGILVEHYVTRESSASAVGNVYLGRVQNVLPSMEAAFVDIGRGRNGVLYAGEVNWDAAGLEGKSRAIENAMHSGDAVLVQVTKDPIGHKGARLTSQISLPGRFVVYVPGGGMTGISRKLPDIERSRLKAILKKAVPDEAGVIVRTAAEGASEEDLISDVERLKAQWESIQTRMASPSNAPTLVYGEPDLAIRVVRDVFNDDFSRLIVAGSQMYTTLTEYISGIAPDLAGKLSRHTGESDLFADLRVDEQLSKALDRKVWLPSGGSLVIDRTEAMWVIDVNTGKYTGSGGNLESTVTRNNLEAAEELVRQLRLRDIGGIVVIDFIDMVLESNRELVLRRLTECLGRDRTKHQVAEVTSLGLVQMTRKRVGEGLLEAFSEPCEHCKGRGVILHAEPIAEPVQDSADSDDDHSGRSRRGRRSKPPVASPDPEIDAVLQSQRRSAATAIAAIAAATAAKDSEPSGAPVSDETGSDEPTPDETVSAETVPNETVSAETVPNETVSDETVPNETVPNETVPNETVSDETVPNETVPDLPTLVPDQTPAAAAPQDLPDADPDRAAGLVAAAHGGSELASEQRASISRPRRRRAASRPAGPPAPVSVG